MAVVVVDINDIVLSSSGEQCELLQWICFDDGTINIVMCITAIINIVLSMIVVPQRECETNVNLP